MRQLLLTTSFIFAFAALKAQDCQSNLYMTNNASMQMTIYDKKGKANGMQNIKVTDVKTNGGNYESTVNTTMTDAKGKTITSGTGTYHCSNGIFSADMKMALPQEGLGNMKDAEVKFEPVYLEYPLSLTIGQSLKDAEFNMDMNMSGMKSSVSFKEQNRKVSSKETVASPAGTWEAFVITYDGAMKTKMAGIGLPGANFTVKEWFVPGMGIVKTESYSKDGKLAGSTLLTTITK